jgi:hypothetical protein
MFPPLTPLTKGKEKKKDESNVGGLLMDLAEDWSEDGTSTPTKTDTITLPPAPTEEVADTTPPAPTETHAGTTPPAVIQNKVGTTLPAQTEKEAGTTPAKPTDPKKKGTTKHDRPPTPGSESSNSDDDGTEVEEYVSCFLEWLGLDPDCKRMLDDEMKMLIHHERKMGNKAVPTFQQALHEDPELFIEARATLTAALYGIREAIFRFDTRLGNISYFTCGQEKKEGRLGGWQEKAGAQGVRVLLFFHLGLWVSFIFMVFVWVHICVFPLGLWFSFKCMFSSGSTSVSSFGFILFLSSFGFLRIQLYGRGEVGFTDRAREEVFRENLDITMSATQLGRGLSYGGCTEMEGCWTRTGRRGHAGIRGGRHGRSDWGHIFGRLQGR